MTQTQIEEIISKIDDRTRLLRLKQVIEIVGMKRSTIYERMSASSFPRPINLGPRAVAWLNTDIQNWIAERASASNLRR
jgi:prophage regulatory protein